MPKHCSYGGQSGPTLRHDMHVISLLICSLSVGLAARSRSAIGACDD